MLVFLYVLIAKHIRSTACNPYWRSIFPLIHAISAIEASLFDLNNWHTLSLILKNGTIQALIDNNRVASVKDSTYTHGQIGLLVSKWIHARFDNISIV